MRKLMNAEKGNNLQISGSHISRKKNSPKKWGQVAMPTIGELIYKKVFSPVQTEVAYLKKAS